ncbi:hypothetical protein ACHAXS_005842 [Conticribra weissflogii]
MQLGRRKRESNNSIFISPSPVRIVTFDHFLMNKTRMSSLDMIAALLTITFYGVHHFSSGGSSVVAFHSSTYSRDYHFPLSNDKKRTIGGGEIRTKSHHRFNDANSKYRRTSSSFSLSDDNIRNNNEDREDEGISIGDVVHNLHGGKYQFSETQYLAGQSVMGRQFANALYSGGSSECDNLWNDEEDDEGGSRLPKWVLRLKDPNSHVGKPIAGVLEFDSKEDIGVGSGNSATVSIKNEERSWEKYYAFIIPLWKKIDDDNDWNATHLATQGITDSVHISKFQIMSPKWGYLAPRGGASNACDESKPYSDGASITIKWNGLSGKKEYSRQDYGDSLLLVIGTEAEIWRYRLVVV